MDPRCSTIRFSTNSATCLFNVLNETPVNSDNLGPEGTTGKVAAGNFVQRELDLLARDRVQLRYQTGDAGYFESSLDVVVVVLLAHEGKQLLAGAVLVFLNNFQGDGVERHNHGPAAALPVPWSALAFDRGFPPRPAS